MVSGSQRIRIAEIMALDPDGFDKVHPMVWWGQKSSTSSSKPKKPTTPKKPAKPKPKVIDSPWKIAHELPHVSVKAMADLDKVIQQHRDEWAERDRLERKKKKQEQLKTDHSKRRLWNIEI